MISPEGDVYQVESRKDSTNWNDPEETSVGITALNITSDDVIPTLQI